jgi:hypothetical protein
MAGKSLRSQLNQIRAWVRQGRTEAWIAHQLEVSASELRDFIRRHDLSAEEDDAGEVNLRDEIEAEIEATLDAEDEDEDEEPDEEEGEAAEKPDSERAEGAGAGRSGGRRRRRRRRRPKRAGSGLEATFDHGETDGFGLWLDPAVEGDPVYAENWKGHRRVEVTIEPDQIIIRRSDGDGSD